MEIDSTDYMYITCDFVGHFRTFVLNAHTYFFSFTAVTAAEV